MWSLPEEPWVLHTMPELGNLTQRWIELQSAATDRYESRLFGRTVATDHHREPAWLVARDRIDLYVAHKALRRSRGLSGIWLARAFRSSRPALLHAHFGPRAYHQRLFARVLRAPLVASFYGYDATERRFTESARWRRRYARLFAAAGAIVVEGPAMANRVERLGCPTEKISIVRLPADEDSLEAVEATKAPGFVVSLAGRFVEKKGFDLGVRAFARAFRGRGDARLLIVGGGELEPELRRVVLEERVSDQVMWRGRLPFERFMAEVATSHIGLYPSREARSGDSEGGAPVTLIEAQWLGVPSIVSSHDDLPFVAAPAGSIVLPPDDLDAWSEALLTLYRDPDRLVEMGRAASAYSRAHHSLADNVRSRDAIYDSVS